jgi:hypothetical protein
MYLICNNSLQHTSVLQALLQLGVTYHENTIDHFINKHDMKCYVCVYFISNYTTFIPKTVINRKMIWKPNKSCSDLQMFFVYFNKLCGLNKIELSCVDFRNLFTCSHFTAILQFFILHWFNLSRQLQLIG